MGYGTVNFFTEWAEHLQDSNALSRDFLFSIDSMDDRVYFSIWHQGMEKWVPIIHGYFYSRFYLVFFSWNLL
jgi:hypothetical protein